MYALVTFISPPDAAADAEDAGLAEAETGAAEAAAGDAEDAVGWELAPPHAVSVNVRATIQALRTIMATEHTPMSYSASRQSSPL